jgi:hypothetical protein
MLRRIAWAGRCSNGRFVQRAPRQVKEIGIPPCVELDDWVAYIHLLTLNVNSELLGMGHLPLKMTFGRSVAWKSCLRMQYGDAVSFSSCHIGGYCHGECIYTLWFSMDGVVYRSVVEK